MRYSSVPIAPVLLALAGLHGCGASPPTTKTAEDPASSGALNGSAAPRSSSDEGAATPPNPAKAPSATPDKPKESAASGSSAAPRASASPVAAESQETFPSGLVVNSQMLGGPAPGPELPKGTKILHVGDSFAGALGLELNKALNAAGLKSRLEFETSTYIPTWAHSRKLPGLLSGFKPDLVLISLGANELENPEPEKRAGLIQKLVKSLGETPCVWIAPVLWDGAKSALLDVIRANVGHCVYLDSNQLVKKMPRAADRIHPSMAARPDWAAATVRWLAYHRRPTDQQPWAVTTEP